MDFRILGPVEAVEDGATAALGGAKQKALLAVLLLNANEVVSTERLIDALWEEPPARPAKAVQVYALRLRKALGERLISRPPGYLLGVGSDQLDLARFRRLREESRHDPATAAGKLRDALDLWRGPALGEFGNEPFARVERLRLEELRLETVEEWIDADLELVRHAALVGELEALVAAEPLRESLRAQLMLALYRCGRQADALAAYREGRRVLVEELGIEPGGRLRALEQQILRQDEALEPDRGAGAPDPSARFAPVADRKPAHAGASSSRDELREERKLVSVLLVDLVDPTERADPEDVRAAARPLQAAVTREVERLGGAVESLAGQAAMALFGAHAAHEDDAERAVRAAFAIRRWITEEGAGHQVRMAVDTGTAIVSIGADQPERDPVAVGQVIATAQRLLTAAPIGEILVGEQTYHAASAAIEYESVPPVEAKGKAATLAAWRAIRASPRWGAERAREPTTPLVGRQRELDLLISTLDRVVEDSSPQLVTLVGVPGIGKSRMVFELSQALERRREPIAWRQGRCLPYGDGVSFWALGEIIKAQAAILESDSPHQTGDKLRAVVAQVFAGQDEAGWVEQQLRPLVGAGGDLSLEGGQGDGFAAWRRFIEGLAELRPFVLVFEDLQWANDPLLEFVDELADRVRNVPLLVLCTARPELFDHRPAWSGGKANALTISLAPLSTAETARLVGAALDGRLLEADVHETLLERAGGNPLYAEQFARVLVETGSLENAPETVHGIIAARLDGLPLAEKLLIQDAAVIGEVFWLGAVESVGGISSSQAQELLFGLERKEFVQRAARSSVAGEAEFMFRHVLVRDIAYGQIPRVARSEKHQRAAAWIESLGRLDDHAEMLAHHFLSALEYGEREKQIQPPILERAPVALRAAGDRAITLASYAAAARFYAAALELWPTDDPERVGLLIRCGRASHAADRTGIHLLEQGFEQLLARDDAHAADEAADVAVELARALWLDGDRDRAYGYIEQALELTAGSPDAPARAYAFVERAAYHMTASEYPVAIRLVREALPLTEARGMEELRVRALDVLGGSRSGIGDVHGLDDAKRAISLARETNSFSRLIVAELNLYPDYFWLGDVRAAKEAVRAVRRNVERYGSADQRKYLRVLQANEAVLDGAWDDASRNLDRLIAEAETDPVQYYLDPASYALRAFIKLARGDPEAASADSESAATRARIVKDPQILAPALTIRAMVLVALVQQEAAARVAGEILAGAPVYVIALVQCVPAATPIEFAWLLRDLDLETELRPALTSAPSTPWVEAARAITEGALAQGLEIVAKLGAPSINAYNRLRTAEAMVSAGQLTDASPHAEHALAFYRRVGATRYIKQAEALRRAASDLKLGASATS